MLELYLERTESVIRLLKHATQNAAVLRFEPIGLTLLRDPLVHKWEQPKDAFGNLTFLFKDESYNACAVVNEGFVEFTSDREDPRLIMGRLARDFLSVAAEQHLRLLGLTIEMIAVLQLPDDVNMDVTVALKRHLERTLSDFEDMTQSKVDAVGLRLFARVDSGGEGRYTFDVTPYFENPGRQVLARLKSRRAGSVSIEQFEKATGSDLRVFTRLIEATPRLIDNHSA